MHKDFEDEFIRSMEELRFSSTDKERLCRRLAGLKKGDYISSDNLKNHGSAGCKTLQKKESEEFIMKKWSFGKGAAVAAVCFIVTGVTAFAASKITSYIGTSTQGYDYTTVNEMTSSLNANLDKGLPEFPESIGNDFAFEGGNIVKTEAKDDGENTVVEADDYSADYTDKAGRDISIRMSKLPFDRQGREATNSRVIEGISVNYDFDEYLFLPDEECRLDEETKERKENDSHFFVSYGGDKTETMFYSTVTFEKDGVSYMISSYDDVEEEELFSIAGELIGR